MDFAALKSELGNDPKGLGYAMLEDADAAALLNLADRPGTAFFISGSDLQNQVIAWGEVEALTAAKRDTLMAILRSESVDLSAGSKTLAYLTGLFSAQSQTRMALAALKPPQESRASELGLPIVGHADVGEARRGNN